MADTPILGFQKKNLPVVTQTAVPNPNNFVGESLEYQRLQNQYIPARTDTGQKTFTSPTSGMFYNTNDPRWLNMSNIYNRGEEGMMNLLNYLYSGKTGWILTADDINLMGSYVDGMINGQISVNNATHLDGHNSTYFATAQQIQDIISGKQKVGNAETLDGFDYTYFATAEQMTMIIDGSVAVGNANKLGGQLPSYYATASSQNTLSTQITNIINGTVLTGHSKLADRATLADNANSLGGVPASNFVQSSSAVATFSGSGVPSASTGKSGDIYVQV